MDKNKNMVILNGYPDDNVVRCRYDNNSKRRIITFANGKSYPYTYNSVEWLENPQIIDVNQYKFENAKGDLFNNIIKILGFKGRYNQYFRIFFADGSIRSYRATDLIIQQNIFSSEKAKLIFDYFTKISQITGLKNDNGKNTLTEKYKKNSFVGKNTVLEKYIHPITSIQRDISQETVLFPFGCNLSQIKAVRNALSNQISIIEGPPGTGKTQTILNIIANIVSRGNTVAVVSNNNDATKNVFEKLEKYGYSYISAQLGNDQNKRIFINEKQTKYPDFSDDLLDTSVCQNVDMNIFYNEKDLVGMFENKNKIAILQKELTALLVEKQYFDEYFNSSCECRKIFKNTNKLSSKLVLNLWNECQFIVEQGKRISFWKKLKYRFKYGMDSFSLFESEVIEIIPQFKKIFYSLKIAELKDEIHNMEADLKEYKFKNKIDELSEKSNLVLKHSLAKKFKNLQRRIFTSDDLWKNSRDFMKEYPVILSSTYSAVSSLNNVIYDYVIVDEASQVDLTTGVLSMACAKNMVIVGDLKQLPNVVTDSMKQKISDISNISNIPYQYRYENHSLLSSACSVFNSAPRTLLREHYRCHPKIIEFCNQKFYNGQLIVMTEDKGEKDVLKVYMTSSGDHARGHFNQRQIHEIQKNAIPELRSKDLGIITPYKDQTSALIKQIQETIPISTVHKFQGRENDDIIISTVDNEISDFTDDPNMLNVAVSRAKNRLRLVISDNEKNQKTNIGDLVRYIEYNNFEIKKSDVFSIFDMLYKCFEESRKSYLAKRKKVSEYDSENLMYALIEEVLSIDKFSNLGVVCHQPLNAIIRDLHKLNDIESKFTMNSWTHIDFMIYNKIDKSPVLAVEVDGYDFHKVGTKQHERDRMKDAILEKYDIPIIRFNTTGSLEKEKLESKLSEFL